MTCYRISIPELAVAEGMTPERIATYIHKGELPPQYVERTDVAPAVAFLCGDFGPPCACGAVSEVLCDGRISPTSRKLCSKPLCEKCAPTDGRGKNYCADHVPQDRKAQADIAPDAHRLRAVLAQAESWITPTERAALERAIARIEQPTKDGAP